MRSLIPLCIVGLGFLRVAFLRLDLISKTRQRQGRPLVDIFSDCLCL